jgi:hypothetical protein
VACAIELTTCRTAQENVNVTWTYQKYLDPFLHGVLAFVAVFLEHGHARHGHNGHFVLGDRGMAALQGWMEASHSMLSTLREQGMEDMWQFELFSAPSAEVVACMALCIYLIDRAASIILDCIAKSGMREVNWDSILAIATNGASWARRMEQLKGGTACMWPH